MFEDRSLPVLHAALDGLAARQRAVSDDIANVDTPFFRARAVAFEDDLRGAVEAGEDPRTVGTTTVWSDAPANTNFNNVDLAAETMLGVRTQLAYELALRATGDRFALLRSAARAV